MSKNWNENERYNNILKVVLITAGMTWIFITIITIKILIEIEKISI